MPPDSTTLKRKTAEAESNRRPSAYQPSTVPLDQRDLHKKNEEKKRREKTQGKNYTVSYLCLGARST